MRTLLLATVFEPHDIGKRLGEARDLAGLTQEQAGDLVDISTRMVQYYEAGEVVPYKHMRDFARVYQKPVEWLLHGDAETTDGEALSEIQRQLADEVARLGELNDLLQERLAPPAAPRRARTQP